MYSVRFSHYKDIEIADMIWIFVVFEHVPMSAPCNFVKYYNN